ncbi:hypothetical protein [Granulicella arctica]|uniref:Uncharacterized protein n=1 Tax=Granulicella arctica TaxID=940613 RepID=A0A7Y9PIY0_9BACT|nr:hypothetical protein [Granulicella arctica]NYF79971.1 hypothetical protein [Granulicella arctica]
MNGVPHLRDSLIVAKVGIVQSTTAFLDRTQNTVILSEGRSTEPKDLRLLLQLPLPVLACHPSAQRKDLHRHLHLQLLVLTNLDQAQRTVILSEGRSPQSKDLRLPLLLPVS